MINMMVFVTSKQLFAKTVHMRVKILWCYDLVHMYRTRQSSSRLLIIFVDHCNYCLSTSSNVMTYEIAPKKGYFCYAESHPLCGQQSTHLRGVSSENLKDATKILAKTHTQHFFETLEGFNRSQRDMIKHQQHQHQKQWHQRNESSTAPWIEAQIMKQIKKQFLKSTTKCT